MSIAHQNDARLMAAALSLASRGIGRTAPNPSVAALVVNEGAGVPVILGRGLTAPGGRPHAEPQAIAQAGSAARGATLVVTLEPCARRSGTTQEPSCSDAIITAGIGRVVLGALDPSPYAAGVGVARLRAAGIAVVSGVLAEEARRMVLGHILRLQSDRPQVSLKLARTRDGFAGTCDHRPLAITGPVSFRHTHVARARADALMVGIGTVLGDDPKLNCRLPGLEDRAPIRVVLDTALRMPLDAFLVHDAGHIPTWIFCAEEADIARADALRRAGVEVTPVARDDAGLNLAQVLAVLALRGITRLMVEGGPCLANALAAQDFIDDFTLMTGPMTVGTGVPAIGPELRRWMQQTGLAFATEWGEDHVEIYERPR